MLTAAALALSLAAEPSWTEQEMVVPGRPGMLYGTVTNPAGEPKAAVLIIAGSGPTDRNGDSAIPGIKPATYQWLAHDLADRGIVVARYDKRGIGQSGGGMTGEADLRFTTYSDDVKTWAHSFKLKTDAPCIWLVGHSEGALLAEVAAQDNPDICGVVLVSGAGRKAADVLRAQLATTPEPTKSKMFEALAQLEAGKTVDPTGLPPALFRASVQPYIISWFALDPAELIKTIKGPVMILQGKTDVQTSLVDAERLAKARPDARLVEMDAVNHTLKTAPGADIASQKATYSDPTIPLAPGVADAIAAFVKGPR